MYIMEITEDKMNNLMEHLTNAVDYLKEMKHSSYDKERSHDRRHGREYDDYDDDYDREERYSSHNERNRGSGGRYSRY